MARSVNSVTLVGHIGRDAEMRYTSNGTPVTTFSVATGNRYKDKATGEWKEQTDWTRVTLWRAEAVTEYLTKGKQVYVQGRLQTQSYEKDGVTHYSTTVVAQEVILLGGGSGSRGDNNQPFGVDSPTGPTMIDDDIPF